jgi:putative endonuclease
MKYVVYVLQNEVDGFYTGSTRNLHERLKRHKRKRGAKFTKGKGIMQLVYFEEHLTRAAAMRREKQIKGYSRKKKSKLVSSHSRSKVVKI